MGSSTRDLAVCSKQLFHTFLRTLCRGQQEVRYLYTGKWERGDSEQGSLFQIPESQLTEERGVYTFVRM